MVLQFEGLRGIAALAVFVYHFHHVPLLAPVTSLAPTFFSMGWVFVDLFFILSGWVMGHVYHDALLRGAVSARSFFLARVARLYPLLLATFLVWYAAMPALGVSVDWAGLRACLPQMVTLSFTWGPLACSVPVAPAWSISAEVAVYLAFPLFLWAGATRTLGRAACLVGVGLLGYAVLASTQAGIHTITGFAPIRAAFGFAIGLGLWRLGCLGYGPKGPAASFLQLAALGALVALFFSENGSPLSAIIALTVLVSALASGAGSLEGVLQAGPCVALGRLSFGIYLWHWFAIIWLQQVAPSVDPVVAAICTLGVVVLWSHASYVFIEAPARRWLRALFEMRPAKMGPALEDAR